MNNSLYRKYRPKTFAELLGNDMNAVILTNAAKHDRLGHAYLFYGSRGTGKTTTARLIAKLLNCEQRGTDASFRALGEPCNACSSCRDIDTNMSLDVIEIDAASNRGIDEIRNLKETIRTIPVGGRYKVYIVDEAHMLTGAACNALLKTLEEPPAHGVIILATTEYEKIPATIASRTQRFLFRKVPKTIIMEKLGMIAERENIAIDPDALELIAAAGDGSFRDAESILEQARSVSASITTADVRHLTGRVGLANVSALAAHIVHGNTAQTLRYLATLQEEGVNIVSFTKELIHYLRRILALRVDSELVATSSNEYTAEEIAGMCALANTVSEQFCILAIKNLIRAYAQMRYAPFAYVSLEVALVELLASRPSA